MSDRVFVECLGEVGEEGLDVFGVLGEEALLLLLLLLLLLVIFICVCCCLLLARARARARGRVCGGLKDEIIIIFICIMITTTATVIAGRT